MPAPPTNSFLEAPLGLTYAKTALPIIFVMGMNGLLPVADALFLGHFVGPEALAAACEEASVPCTLRLQPGYDHSYFFIASFIDEHLRYHAEKLQ